MKISEEDRNVRVGGTYNGAKVTNLEEKTTETDSRIHTKKYITVDTGVIYILDLYEDKPKESLNKSAARVVKGKPKKANSKDSLLSKSSRDSLRSSRSNTSTASSNNSSSIPKSVKTTTSTTSNSKKSKKKTNKKNKNDSDADDEYTTPKASSSSKKKAPPVPPPPPYSPSSPLAGAITPPVKRNKYDINRNRAGSDSEGSMPEAELHKIPNEFKDGRSFPITVFPRSDVPDDGEDGGREGIGEWRYPDGHGGSNDRHFMPQDIDLYYGNDEPLYPASLESSMSSFGLWGLDAGDDAPHQSWTRKAKSVCFPPGIEPSSDVDIMGRWVYNPEKDIPHTAWPPPMTKNAWVFTKDRAPDEYDASFVPRASQGIWRSNEQSFDDLDWDPQMVNLHDEADEDVDESGPYGIWGLRQGVKPDSNTNMFPPKEVWFYPPGEESEPECLVKGRWSMEGGSKAKAAWPPRSPQRKLSGIRKGTGPVQIPDCFQSGKLPIKVFPKSKYPKNNMRNHDQGNDHPDDNDPNAAKIKKKVRFDLIGQWYYPDGEEVDDNDHWMPQTVDLYLGDSSPPIPASEESSIASFGLWGTKRRGSNDSVSLSLSLDWTPEDSLVFPPGIEPDKNDDTIEIHGKWALPGGNTSVKIEWPPPMAESAWVFPYKCVPGTNNTETRGIWKFGNNGKNKSGGGGGGDKEDERHRWQAKKVKLYNEDEIDDPGRDTESKVWGKWGIRKGAEPDARWNWEPEDLWFYPPNEEPEKDCNIQGSWSAEKATWPPPTRTMGKSLREVGKLKIPLFDSPKSPSPSPSRLSVGKLKMPATFGEVASPQQKRSVAKLRIPDKFL